MKSYLLRDIPEDLWRQYKAACDYYGTTIKADFLRHTVSVVCDYRVLMRMKKPGPPAARARKEV